MAAPYHLLHSHRGLVLILGGLLGLIGGMGTAPASAQTPPILHYQATLVEDDFPVEGTVDLEVAFFADSTGGNPLAGWSETRSDVPVESGRISLLIGRQTPLPEELFEEASLYLQLTVEGESLPRVRLASSPYALRSRRAEAVAPSGVTAEALAEEAVTGSALADGAVATEALADQGVTTRALADGAVGTENLADGAVGTNAISDGAVTSAKLGEGAVAGETLANGAVTTEKLANDAVTSSKVESGELVTALNDLTDRVRLVGGKNVSVSSDADEGTITIDADKQTGQPSSRRWKTDIQPLEGLDLVRQLRGVRYQWKESGDRDLGLIAEEVGAVVPEVVTYDSNGVDARSVNYAKLAALLIEAVKEQQSQIEEDRALLKDLQERLEALEDEHSSP